LSIVKPKDREYSIYSEDGTTAATVTCGQIGIFGGLSGDGGCIYMMNNGFPFLGIKSEFGGPEKTRVMIGASKEKGGFIWLMNQHGKLVWSAP
jgi:hypothetical protein